MTQQPEITHTSTCDLAECVNYGLPHDAWTLNGVSAFVICGGCNRDISHTLSPKE